MVPSQELVQLEKDFLSGKNPLAYIPLCIALRRQKQFMRALELCQRGIAGDSGSLAGRALYARLLSDVGHYEEALKELSRAETLAPEAMGVLLEKARCMIRLKRVDEAEALVANLAQRNPMDPQVQMLNTQLRQHRGQLRGGTTHHSRDEVPRFIRKSAQELLDIVKREMKAHVSLISVAVIPTGAGAPALEGDATAAEAAYSFWKEANLCCKELDCGSMRVGLMETGNCQMFVVVKRNTLLAMAIRPSANIGKIYYRFQMIAGQLLPDALDTADTQTQGERRDRH